MVAEEGTYENNLRSEKENKERGTYVNKEMR